MLTNLQVTTLVLLTPLLTFLIPRSPIIGKTTCLTKVERSFIVFYSSHHLFICLTSILVLAKLLHAKKFTIPAIILYRAIIVIDVQHAS